MLIGFAAGFALALPPTGPVALLVLREAVLERPVRAVATAVGSALGGAPYVVLGALGYRRWVVGHPGLSAAFDALAAAMLLGIGAKLLWDAARPDPAAAGGDRRGRALGAILRGAAIAAANPTRVLAWAVVVSVVRPLLGGATLWTLFWFAAGAGAGEVAWAGVQACALRWCAEGTSDRLRRWLLRGGAAIALLAGAAVVVRAAW